MPSFRLDKVLDYRSHLRLDRRHALQTAIANEQELVIHQQHVQQQRTAMLNELTTLAQAREMDVAAAARRRHFVSRLEIEILILEQQLTEARRKVEIARAELIKADQDVKALEKLKEKHLAEQTYVAAKATERELSEQWQAANWEARQ